MRNSSLPPKIAEWILKRIPDFNTEFDVTDDFRETYSRIASTEGRIKAGIWYWCHVFLTLYESITFSTFRSIAMYKNYLKIALRNVGRQKTFSIINISGLAIGLACCFLILLWVQFELSYDRFHEDYDKIFKVICKGEIILNNYDGTPGPLGPAAVEQLPGVKNYVRLWSMNKSVFKYGNKSFYETRGVIVDPSFFEIFTFPFENRDTLTPLNNTNWIVISRNMANRYFPDEDPEGKILISEFGDFEVVGVLKEIPENSHIKVNYLLSIEMIPDDFLASWRGFNFVTYLKTDGNIDASSTANSITDIARENNTYQVVDRGGSFYLEPLTDVHLYDNNSFRDWVDLSAVGYVYAFSAASIIILIIACANFINLSTARSALRAKEIGIRKTIGAYKRQLTRQFFAESILLTLISSITGLLLVYITLPVFNRMFELNLHFSLLDLRFSGIALGVVLLTGIVSGIYPAIALSSFNPTEVLKAGVQSSIRGTVFKKGMVVVQFALSIVLIISTSIIFNQINYIQSKDLGFNKDQIVYIPMKGEIFKQYQSVKNEMLTNSNISHVSAQMYSFAETQRWSNVNTWEGKDKNFSMSFIFNHVDFDFIEMMGIEIVEGRSFSKDYAKDSQEAFIINEAGIKKMGIEPPVIGKPFSFGSPERKGRIVGVIKDVHFRSLHDPIVPNLFMIMNNTAIARDYGCMLIKYKAAGNSDLDQTTSGVISHIKTVWDKFNADVPFEYKFLDDAYGKFYTNENRTGLMLRYFTFFAILVACLGLFGLSSFMAERRIKEIGIRKTLGASNRSIVGLTTRDYILLVGIANVLAWPAAYFIMKKWLTLYSYSIELGITAFILSGIFSLLTAITSVGSQSLKAAWANPVESLRYE